MNEYLSGVFDEEEPKYPENDDIVEKDLSEDEDEDDEVDEDLEEKKNIPIIPIQKPINKEIVPGTLKDDMPFNKPEDSKEIEEFNELKNNKYDSLRVNKQENIQDESDEEFSDEEENDQISPTLF